MYACVIAYWSSIVFCCAAYLSYWFDKSVIWSIIGFALSLIAVAWLDKFVAVSTKDCCVGACWNWSTGTYLISESAPGCCTAYNWFPESSVVLKIIWAPSGTPFKEAIVLPSPS